MKSISNYLSLAFLKFAVLLFKWIPFWVLYRISDILFFLIYYILGYRKKVVLNNLNIAFPNRSDQSKQLIAKKFFKNLCDIILEGIKGFSLSKKDILDRYKFFNTHLLDEQFDRGQSVILIGSHYANWEWGVLSVSLWLKHTVIGIYKPIKNDLVDQYFNTIRKQWGLELAKMKDTGRAIVRNRHRNIAYVLIADQSPSDLINAHWVNFFNKKTPFLHGVDKIGRMTNYPIFIFHIKRTRRGHYEVHFDPLIPQPKATEATKITQSFASHLESYIKKNPQDWLWSHRRWKRNNSFESVDAQLENV